MFIEYIDILAECSKVIIKQMADIDIASVEIKKLY